jgi:hypothetical protein
VVHNYHQIWFLNHCRCATADNLGLSVGSRTSADIHYQHVLVQKFLLIIGINSGFRTRTVVDTPSKTRVSSSLLF